MCAFLGWFLLQAVREQVRASSGALSGPRSWEPKQSVNTMTYCRVPDRELSPIAASPVPSLITDVWPTSEMVPRSRAVLAHSCSAPAYPQHTHTHSKVAGGGCKLTLLECHKVSITTPKSADEKTGSEREVK